VRCCDIVWQVYIRDREMPTFYCTLGSWYLCAMAIKSGDIETYLMLAWLSLQLLSLTFQQNHAPRCRLKRALAARALLSPDAEKKFICEHGLCRRRFVLLRRQERGCGSINLFLGFDTKTFSGRNKNGEEFQCTVQGRPCFWLKTLSLSPF